MSLKNKHSLLSVLPNDVVFLDYFGSLNAKNIFEISTYLNEEQVYSVLSPSKPPTAEPGVNNMKRSTSLLTFTL